MSRTIEVLPIMGNRKTTPPEVSEKLKRESRVSGSVFEEVMDTECAFEGCGRIFVPRLEGQEYCIKHRSINNDAEK